jgi:hypothetical protein
MVVLEVSAKSGLGMDNVVALIDDQIRLAIPQIKA